MRHRNATREHAAPLAREYGAEQVRYYRAILLILKPTSARTQAALARAEAEEPSSLSISESTEQIEATNAERGHKQREAAGRKRRSFDPF